MGTSKHLSAGTYAVVSLMTATSINKFKGTLFPLEAISSNRTNETTPLYLFNDPIQGKIMISMTLSLVSGLIQV